MKNKIPAIFVYILIFFLLNVASFHKKANLLAGGIQKHLEWEVETSKEVYYPGEPVLLKINIRNTADQNESVYFGADGIEAFSMEIRDINDNVIYKGEKIIREGFGRSGYLPITSKGKSQKLIVLNQWCSTILLPGKYNVKINIDYHLFSEYTKVGGTENGYNAGPIRSIQLNTNLQIIKMDNEQFKKIIENFISYEVRPGMPMTKISIDKMYISREMLAFTESDIAIPYQLQLLQDKMGPGTSLKKDIINTLVKSKTLEAAEGLVKFYEDTSAYKEDIKWHIIEAVYKLRETKKPDIIEATNSFVEKYKLPVKPSKNIIWIGKHIVRK